MALWGGELRLVAQLTPLDQKCIWTGDRPLLSPPLLL